MRINRRIFESLNSSVNKAISTQEEEIAEEIADILDLKEEDIEDITDAEAADRIIRYNQVVNRALRAKFLSRTRRRAI